MTLKYISTALALRAFSTGSFGRRLYRTLGNRVGNRRRSTGVMPGYYVERVARMVKLINLHGILSDGDRILELGTGWLHWEALTLRLFFDIEAVLFDVWDNRQLGALKNYVGQLATRLDELDGLSESQRRRARTRIGEIVSVPSFEELYGRLGFRYVVNASGSLESLADSSFQLVVSAGVLEHVHESAVENLLSETRRVLRPAGWALHSIDTSDHLAHYDSRASLKQYLAISDRAWNWLFNNGVQHINRIQRGEWLHLFRKSGFELVDEDSRMVAVGNLSLSPRFASLDRRDLGYTVLRLALKRA